MKIVKKGILLDKTNDVYTGTCRNCHCQIEEIRDTELSFSLDGLPYIICPTLDCYEKVYCWKYLTIK
jgi:hypothetical protein